MLNQQWPNPIRENWNLDNIFQIPIEIQSGNYLLFAKLDEGTRNDNPKQKLIDSGNQSYRQMAYFVQISWEFARITMKTL